MKSRVQQVGAWCAASLFACVASQIAAAEQFSEPQKRSFMKSCIENKKSDKDYADKTKRSGTTAEGTCEQDLQKKLK